MTRISLAPRVSRPSTTRLESLKTKWESLLIDGTAKKISKAKLPASAKSQLQKWAKTDEQGVVAYAARIGGVETYLVQRDGRATEKRGSAEVLGVYVMFDAKHRLSVGWSSDSPQIYWS